LVGICSYLLVNFWYTRIAANQSSISALLTNRVGDCFLTIGMFAVLCGFGNEEEMLFCSFIAINCVNQILLSNKCVLRANPGLVDPNFITGFSDGESCFYIGIRKTYKVKVGWLIELKYVINLHKKDQPLLELIKTYFGVGLIQTSQKSVLYVCQSIKELDTIIKHFDNFPLITQKRADFILFKKPFELVKCKKHLTAEGLKEIIAIKASINRGLTEQLKTAFPDRPQPVPRPSVEDQEIKDPNWLAGFTAAEGCFLVDVQNSNSHKTGKQVILKFQISQNIRDENLLKSFISYLDCGRYYLGANRDRGDFRVHKFHDITNKIIPLLKKYPIHGVKAENFADFCEIAELMSNNAHTTAEGLDKIINIKAGMNRGRDP